jgi:hypothetical protein
MRTLSPKKSVNRFCFAVSGFAAHIDTYVRTENAINAFARFQKSVNLRGMGRQVKLKWQKSSKIKHLRKFCAFDIDGLFLRKLLVFCSESEYNTERSPKLPWYQPCL